jgi:hypothetical protein
MLARTSGRVSLARLPSDVVINVHHIDYDRIGNERFSDLMVICKECHSMLHRKIDEIASKRDGRTRTAVMRKLKYYCQKRIMEVHNVHERLRIDALDHQWTVKFYP